MNQTWTAMAVMLSTILFFGGCAVTKSDETGPPATDSSMSCADGTQPPCGRDEDSAAGSGGDTGGAATSADLGTGGVGGDSGSMSAGATDAGGAAGQDGGGGGTAGTGGAETTALGLSLDVRCAATSPRTVRLVGPKWNNWDPNSGPVASDDNSDGIWQVAFDPAPEDDLEYLWNVDGAYEDLIGLGDCAPSTDGATYANRVWPAGAGSRTDTYNTCGDCDRGTGGAGGGAGDLPRITVDGRRILIDGMPFHMKGVNWNPVPRGRVHPAGLDYAGLVGRDAPLMEAAGINVVRTYETILDHAVLDALWARGIYVMSTVYAWGGAPADSVIAKVAATRDHPAILMWAVGNEWNYNGLYSGMSLNQSIERLNDVIRLVKETDPTRPVATVYGEVPSRAVIARMPEVDWAVFDWQVNSGNRSAKALQRNVGAKTDGAVGPMTLQAVANHDPEDIIRNMHSSRDTFYRSLKLFDRYGRGWTRRNDETLQAALQMLGKG